MANRFLYSPHPATIACQINNCCLFCYVTARVFGLVCWSQEVLIEMCWEEGWHLCPLSCWHLASQGFGVLPFLTQHTQGARLFSHLSPCYVWDTALRCPCFCHLMKASKQRQASKWVSHPTQLLSSTSAGSSATYFSLKYIFFKLNRCLHRQYCSSSAANMQKIVFFFSFLYWLHLHISE